MTSAALTSDDSAGEIVLKNVLKMLSHSMTIRITEKRLAKILWTKRGTNLELDYEGDDGSRRRDPWIPPAYFRQFTTVGGSRDAFIAWLESKGARQRRHGK